jgi:endoglucanase
LRRRTSLSLSVLWSVLAGACVWAGCGSLFPSGGGGAPPGTVMDPKGMVVHNVRVNTVGYVQGRAKIATVVLPSGMTTLSDATAQVVSDSGNVAWTCTMTGPMSDPALNNAIYYFADFTAFDNPGTFTINVPALGTGDTAHSAPFLISSSAMLDPLTAAMTAMYGQRCGTSVQITRLGKSWHHAACHQDDAASLKYLTGEDTPFHSVGGWHDAGDYGKYTNNGAFSVGMLLAAWEQFTPTLSTLALPIPEHGMTADGGTAPMPDFLWEVKWELDWLLTAQAASGNGGVPDKLTAVDFESFGVMPQADGSRRYFSGMGTAMTADFVAVMAEAARIYHDYAPTDATNYLNAAQQSYAFLQTTSGPPYAANDDPNPSSTMNIFKTGHYAEGDLDNRVWAAAEMWETTGDPAALKDFETRANTARAEFASDFDWASVQNLGLYTYVLSRRPTLDGTDSRDPALVASLNTSLTSVADGLVTTASTNIYGRAIGNNYYWGSNGSVARTAMTLSAANVVSPNPKYLDAIQLQVDFLLGRNYYDRSQVTVLGYHPPMNPHHGPSVGDGVVDPWPGLLVGGANSTTRMETGSDYNWVDDPSEYEVNEVAINWNAPFIFATAALTPPSP